MARSGHLEGPTNVRSWGQSRPRSGVGRCRLLTRCGLRRCLQHSRDDAMVYSITLSARTRTVPGIESPSAFAVVMLTTKSNLVGCSTGMSAGLVPRRI